MNTLEVMLNEALAYQAEAFKRDEPVDGADLVEWFAEWRERVQTILADSPVTSTDADDAQPRTMPLCSACGGENVCADAAARWDAEAKVWEVVNIFDKGHSCDDCESSDVRLDWREEEKRAGFL